MQSIQNLGLAVVTLLAGMILDARGYILLEVFFLALLCGALITGVILYMWDAAKGVIHLMIAKYKSKHPIFIFACRKYSKQVSMGS